MSNEKDYYAVLGVSPDADAETIETAYERAAHELQPDVNAEPADPDRMRELDEAFDVLDDPAKRAEYDRTRAEGAVISPPPPAWGAGGTAAAAATAEGSVPGGEAVGDAAGTPASPKGLDGRLIAGVGLLLAGVVAMIAGVGVLVLALTDDDGGGTQTTSTGLQYTDTTKGSGATPQNGQVVTINYTGMLSDGSVFDSSESRGPLALTLGAGQVIPGLEEGISGMQVGGSRTIVIPPDLAYGEAGAGNGVIPPNETITFDLELLAVDDKPPATPPEVNGDKQELESGLVAIDVVEGSGNEAATGDLVSVHYTGWLEADGTQFDSSLTTPRVFSFTTGQGKVIRGWDAGVPGMKEGGRRRLIVPAALAYGDQAQGDKIPANANLIFDIELIAVRKPAG